MSGTRDASATLPKYELDAAFYVKVRGDSTKLAPAERFVIPPNNGRGFIAKQGQTFRVIEEEGPQVADVMLWNAHDKSEYFSTARTWLMEGMFVRPLTRLWSDVPRFRPIAVCVDETVDAKHPDSEYGHHFVKTHCCPEVMEARLGMAGLNACHLNLLQAIEPFSLGESDMHDNINVHQKVRIDPRTGKSISARTASEAGDYIEFYANIDLLVAVSVCPNGDNTAHQANLRRPIGIEIRDTGTVPPAFPEWTDWRPGWKGRWLPPDAAAAT